MVKKFWKHCPQIMGQQWKLQITGTLLNIFPPYVCVCGGEILRNVSVLSETYL